MPNLFSVIKAIPVVGPAVKVTTTAALAVGCALTGNMDEFAEARKQLGLGMDVANLNPLKALNNLASTVRATFDLTNGVWVGKRPLDRSQVSFTIAPGESIGHWGILIEGTLYQITGQDSNEYCMIEITDDPDEIDSFTWNHLANSSDVTRTSSQLGDFAKSFEKQKYCFLFSDVNTQTFVVKMFEFCCGNFSQSECKSKLMTKGGTTWLM